MPAWRWNGPCVRATPARPPCCCWGSCSPERDGCATPSALYVLGDMYADRGDWAGAAQWFAELVARYPADVRASLARFRLAAETQRHGLLDSAAALYQAEVATAAPQRTAARFWLGRLALLRGDTAAAEA